MTEEQAETAPGRLIARGRRALSRSAPVMIPLLLFAALAEYLYFVDDVYAIERWLFWRYAYAWALALFWSAACLSAGHLVLRLLRRTLPIHEHLLTSIAVGAFVFCLGNFGAGLLHLYGTAFFVLWPLSMLAAGLSPLQRYLRRATRHLRHARARSGPGSPWLLPTFAFGLLGLVMVYFLILTPDNTAYDACWKHIAVAETYAVEGGIRRFGEGWTVVTYPHLVSILFTWGFLAPGKLFDHVEICAHLEFVIFLWTTLLGIPALVRRLVPRAAPALVWPARFLFPGVLLYDSNLSLGADHVGAIWAVASFTLLIRAYRDLSPSYCALLALTLAGGIQTKMTALILLLPFPIAAIAVRVLVLGGRAARGQLDPALRRNLARGPLTALGVGLACTAPFWLKNWIWYGDPFYPVLHKYLALKPWTPDAARVFEQGYAGQFWRPTRDVRGVLKTLRALFTYTLAPNDWPKFHGRVPTFGSILTFGMACLPFLKGTKRIWALVLCIHVSVAAWYWTHHQDRYLQTIIPWMAAGTAAIMVLVWRSGIAARISLSALVLGQIIWMGDVYFIPTHAMSRSAIKASVDLLATGYLKRWERRERWFSPLPAVAKELPPKSRVLLHEIREHAGIHASTVSDFVGWQGGISYGRLGSPRETYALLRSLGVTHLLWDTTISKSWDSLAGDIVFFDFALRHGVGPKPFGKMTLAAMPEAPPPDEGRPDTVAYLGCNKTFRSGLYTLADMRVPVFGTDQLYPAPRAPAPPRGEAPDALIDQATFVIIDPACYAMPDAEEPSFVLAATREAYEIVPRSGLEIWIRWDRSDPKPAPKKRPPPPASPQEPSSPALEQLGAEGQ